MVSICFGFKEMMNKEYRHFVLYDNITGRIFQDGKMLVDAISHQNTDTKTAMESHGESHLTHYVDLSGETPTIVRMPDRPSKYCSFDYVGHAWKSDAVLAETSVRAERDARMAAFQWRLDRYASEVRLGLPTTDNIAVLDCYMQSLRDITGQAGFPFSIIWPLAPQQ